ncbi:LLM class flavin-dependent oxidoreductase [Amycolatopsis keratiniphila]|uniref:LLM class flavin-dependent oxidoreductase n=1 Tax=Amycolatopsis keratiniphila TaxID=129921 RepID=UPI00087D0B19|nr:LLM class flavin-dependent oxidoreductase [Amycolatopsis keratiniphila]OLZ49877.1 luciferase [Amycolatopsis keratiniphila subsp. nogabecina]SDU25375.1 probable oxidoreductase, LLM family [Amycolatopsis keratiniphila]
MAYEILGTPQAPTFGLDTFGDVGNDANGRPVSQAEAIREVVAEGVLADQVGVDYFGVGEHHRAEMAVSSPDVVLAAIAGRTERIRLGTAVTVLSSDDPVRVYERFATLDAVSRGRAEVTLGRGSFTESFPLFGYSLEDYEALFAEKLDLFTHLQTEKPVDWSGTVRPALEGAQAFPVTESGSLPAWVGVGGTPQSVVRAAAYGLPLVMAVIGGSPERFTPLADLYRRALKEAGHQELPISMHSPGHIAETDELAVSQHFSHHQAAFAKIGAERGWGPMSRADYDAMAGPRGALFVGSPETVAQKIAWAVRTLGLSRFQLKYSVGELPHEQRLNSIRLYGEQVIPRVKELLG